MTERAQRITSILHAAIERAPNDRGHYLDGACAGDEALRFEIEELIKSHESAGNPISSAAVERGAGLPAGVEMKHSVIPASGGRPVKQFDFPGFQYQHFNWTPDSRNLSFIGSPPDPSNIWLQPIAGGEPRQLTNFKSDYIFDHAWASDGRSLVLVRGRETADVVLMRDTR